MLSATKRQNKALADEWLHTAIEYKVEWERKLQRRDALGITDLPMPFPHPDQVRINMNAGTARVQGPMTKEDQQQLEHWIERREAFAQEELELEENIQEAPDEAVRKLMQADIVHAQKMVAMIDELLEKIGF